eukprot:6724301-Prymnesium_polylepis.1
MPQAATKPPAVSPPCLKLFLPLSYGRGPGAVRTLQTGPDGGRGGRGLLGSVLVFHPRRLS